MMIAGLLVTETSSLLLETQTACEPYLRSPDPTLHRDRHIEFLHRQLHGLPSAYMVLDASRPWLCYWSLNSLALLGAETASLREAVVGSILPLQQPEGGGFGGGHMQTAHLATTYAAISALSFFPGSLSMIDRPALYRWLLSLKHPVTGAFAMTVGGEVDVRAAYCCLAVASLCSLVTPELTAGLTDWLQQCQTYEGGIAGEPGVEAHGGYTFVALASIAIMHGVMSLKTYYDLPALVRWLSLQQTEQGGFSGRTNKLVDGCYSWWIGGSWVLAQAALGESNRDLWSRESLIKYVQSCCQCESGGLRDKPGKYVRLEL